MDAPALRARLLAWYDANARDLAWRIGPVARAGGVLPDPYRVWLSEVMLQQTTVPHATRYFLNFTTRWPTLEALAAAPEAEVMAAWAGLGYYARARNLIACARAVAHDHDGVFPDSEEALRALPGLGVYTAAAVAAIAFDRTANVVDGNVERVVARLFAVATPLPAAKPALRRLAETLLADHRPGDWAQALMDLGATICRPRTPLCPLCPVENLCAARAAGAPQTYPRKTARAERPRRRGVAFVLLEGDRVALVRRPGDGLLGGMLGLPTSDWSATDEPSSPPVEAVWRDAGAVEHVFTHFTLTLRVRIAEAQGRSNEFEWLDRSEALVCLPTVFAKALRVSLQTVSNAPILTSSAARPSRSASRAR